MTVEPPSPVTVPESATLVVLIFEAALEVTIGGPSAGAGNVIVGLAGISVDGGSAAIEGNYINTDASGSVVLNSDLRGTLLGIELNLTTNATILRNVVVSNSAIKIRNSTGASVRGNFIGTDATGTTFLGGVDGIKLLQPDTGTMIGGTSPSDRNVIGCAGQRILLTDASNTTVAGNYIGVNAAGTAAFAQLGAAGVRVTGTGNGNVIGGSTAGAGNVIAGNNNIGSNGGAISLGTASSVSP